MSKANLYKLSKPNIETQRATSKEEHVLEKELENFYRSQKREQKHKPGLNSYGQRPS